MSSEGLPGSTPAARQRWRVTFRRDAAAATVGGRDLQAGIEARLAEARVPVVGHTQLAAALAGGLAAERELLDVILSERWPVTRARETFAAALPPGHEIVDCYDVWLGQPALAAQASGADYRATLGPGAPAARDLRAATADLLASPRLERTRVKGDRTVAFDIRPLLRLVEVDDGPPVTLAIGLRIDPERGSGRPDEILAELAERCHVPELPVSLLTRTQVALRADD